MDTVSISLGDDLLVRDGGPAADINGALSEYNYIPVMASTLKSEEVSLKLGAASKVRNLNIVSINRFKVLTLILILLRFPAGANWRWSCPS